MPWEMSLGGMMPKPSQDILGNQKHQEGSKSLGSQGEMAVSSSEWSLSNTWVNPQDLFIPFPVSLSGIHGKSPEKQTVLL